MHPVLGLFSRHRWATEELLRFCAGLPPELLTRADPDVYGSIEALFNHLVAAEQRYLYRLDGTPPVLAEDRPLPLPQLAAPAAECAERWRALLASEVDGERVREHRRGDTTSRLADWLLYVQAVHHGDDHRTQVNTLLTRQGVEPPDLDGWAFGESGPADPGAISAGARLLLPRFFGHHLWATHQQMRQFVQLTDEQREVSAPGTYGSLEATLVHLQSADATYRARLDAVEWMPFVRSEPDYEVTLPRRGRRVPAWVVAVQAIHHGNDHRTHVGTVTLANGLSGPDVDVWSYAVAVGAYSEP